VRRAAALLAIALGQSAAAQDLPALHAVTGVAAGDRLNLRAGPSATAEAVGALAPGAAGIEVVETTADGRWGRVNVAEGTAWVAMRYLAAEPGPPWHAMVRPLACYGTEPFWSLAIPPAGAPLRLERMGEGSDTLPRTLTSPAFDRPSTVGIGLGGPRGPGFALIRAEACSDGMSDRVMGLSLHMFLAGPSGTERYSGCCTLEQ
jgi:uncharacterized membrane protein